MRHSAGMTQLTIRNVPEEVAARLKLLSEQNETSINATVLAILEGAVGVKGRRERLDRYVTWTDTDLEAFTSSLASQRVVDDELLR